MGAGTGSSARSRQCLRLCPGLMASSCSEGQGQSHCQLQSPCPCPFPMGLPPALLPLLLCLEGQKGTNRESAPARSLLRDIYSGAQDRHRADSLSEFQSGVLSGRWAWRWARQGRLDL